jgi:hypothetical protein
MINADTDTQNQFVPTQCCFSSACSERSPLPVRSTGFSKPTFRTWIAYGHFTHEITPRPTYPTNLVSEMPIRSKFGAGLESGLIKPVARTPCLGRKGLLLRGAREEVRQRNPRQLPRRQQRAATADTSGSQVAILVFRWPYFIQSSGHTSAWSVSK